MKPLLFLLAGLLVGAAGGALFVRTLPPDTPAGERAAKLETDLERAENRIRALENIDDIRERMPVDASRERAREIMNKIRRGEPISLDDFFRAFQPALRDTAPIFNRLRVLEQTERFDSLLGEYARKYGLTEGQAGALRNWFEQKAKQNNRRFNDVIYDDNATVFDLIEATRNDSEIDEGIETQMVRMLEPEEFREFKRDRLEKQALRVQRDADAKLARLGRVVELREDQQDRLFVAFAKGSPHYDPEMAIEGVGGAAIDVEPGGSPYEAVYGILDEEQGSTLRAETERRRKAENSKLRAVGLALPETWDPLELTGINSL